MIMFYYEISDAALMMTGGKKYFFTENLGWYNTPITMMKISQYSNRIWREDEDGKVTFIKHRTGHLDTPVDMKEFFWVKLKCAKI